MISGRIVCMVSNGNSQLLRTQLDHLHSEFDHTRRKANNARFRLIRLSEAAENLCRQATKNLRMGQENDAREILIQKKKVMLALEKSKDRVELLDELAAKLNEAISIKEAQLMENVASDLEIDGSDSLGPVRIVSPAPSSMKNLSDKINIDINHADVVGDQESIPGAESPDKAIITDNFSRMSSSYIDFLSDVDKQLEKIERDLRAISELSDDVPENEEKLKNSGVPRIPEIISYVCDTRARIHNFVDQTKTSSLYT